MCVGRDSVLEDEEEIDYCDEYKCLGLTITWNGTLVRGCTAVSVGPNNVQGQ